MTLKKEIEGILHPEKRLHPPRAPLVGEISVERNIREGVEPVIESQGNVRHLRAVENQSSPDSRPTIDFLAIAQASEFQRFIYWILTGETFRGSNKALKMKLYHTRKKINMVRGMPPDVLKELKEVLRKRNE